MSQVELLCYLSPHVRKAAAVGNINSEFITWRVNPSKPFEDIENFGALSQALGIHTLCELCDYSEGVVKDVIDTRRTPEELGFRIHMAVYLRQKRSSHRSGMNDASKRAAESMHLSNEEENLLNRLRETTRTSLTPDQPCPVCNRVVEEAATSPTGRGPPQSAGSSRRLRRRSSQLDQSQGPSDSPEFSLDRTPGFRLTSEVGVQCGIASRLGDPFMQVSFGTAARLKVHGDAYGTAVDDFPAPSTMGGPSFLKHDGELTELKSERDRYKGERDQLANLLREEQRKVHELQRERQEHRCEGNEKVQHYLQEIERLQANLRDLMRGRDEVFSLLHQRRTAAAPGMTDTPRPYAPFRVGAPMYEPIMPNPHELLSKSAGTIPRNALTSPTSDRSGEVRTAYADENRGLLADIAVVKRPSGPPSLASQLLQSKDRTDGPQGHLDQPQGQAMLRMFSSVGDPYYVKRLINSQLKFDRNYLVLSSLDRVATDDIEVDDLVQVQVEGDGMLAISTERHQWVLFMNARERQRWVNWLFVLNPWLSTSKNYAVPNNF